MAAARIAAVAVALLVVALLSVQLSAQPAPQGKVNIQAQVICGGAIQGARIEVDPSLSEPGPVQDTDSQGRAVLVLPIGVHTVSITFKGLEPWTRQIDVRGGENPPVAATLHYGGGTIVDCVILGPSSSPLIPLGEPDPSFLPLQPLSNFDPLPSRQAKKRW
jgi:hypothetical protein